jgi:hypothetical protein
LQLRPSLFLGSIADKASLLLSSVKNEGSELLAGLVD